MDGLKEQDLLNLRFLLDQCGYALLHDGKRWYFMPPHQSDADGFQYGTGPWAASFNVSLPEAIQTAKKQHSRVRDTAIAAINAELNEVLKHRASHEMLAIMNAKIKAIEEWLRNDEKRIDDVPGPETTRHDA